jgi:GT2 family glycosyltransferase
MPHTTHGTISIVSHGHGPLVRNLLRDLVAQDDIDNWHVILTLNIPEDISESDLAGLRATVVRNSRLKGFGENHNAAAEMAQGELFVIVNPDIRLIAPDTLVQLVAEEWGGDRPALRAPIVVAPDGGREDSVRRNLSLFNLLHRARHRVDGWEADPTGPEFFWLAGMFLIAPIDTFRALGGFDERFRLYCEDYDLSARWRIGGGRVEIMPNLKVVHDARRDSHRSFRHMKWHVASLLRVWRSAPFWKIVAMQGR